MASQGPAAWRLKAVRVNGFDVTDDALSFGLPRESLSGVEVVLTNQGPTLTGKATDFHGEFFDMDAALIVPAPENPIPVVIGGRSDAAVRRVGRLGDGWLGLWNSPRR